MKRILALLMLTGCGGVTPTTPSGPPPLPQPGRLYTAGLPVWAANAGWSPNIEERALAEVSTRTLPAPPSLNCLAREYAARFGADGVDPPPSVVQALATHCGYWGRPKEALAVTGKPADVRKLFADRLSHPKGVLGLGAVPHPDGQITAALLLSDGALSLQPTPRTPGAWTIEGRLQKGEGQIEIWVADERGARPLAVESQPTGAFKASGRVEPGARVEIARRRQRFKQTLGLLIAGAPPDGYEAPPQVADRPDPKAAAREIAAALNAARAAKGLPALKAAEHLNGRLDSYMERLAAGQASGAPEGMLDERGWPYAQIRYGFSEGQGAPQAVALFLQTPTGEALVMNPRAEMLAVGLRRFKRAAGFDALIAALAPFESKPPEAARAILLARLNAARVEAQLPPLAASGPMEALAQKIAEATLEGRIPYREAVPTTIEEIKANPPLAGAFGVGSFTVISPEEATFTAQAMRPEMRHVGVGVLGGPTPGGGAPRYVVIFIVSSKERAAPEG